MPAIFRDWDKEMRVEKEGWCGRFVGSLALWAGTGERLQQEVCYRDGDETGGYVEVTIRISLHATLAGKLAGFQRRHASVWSWNNVMDWKKEVGGYGLTDLLEIGAEKKARLQEMVCHRARDETGGWI